MDFFFLVIQKYQRNYALNVMFVLHPFIGHKCKLNGYYDLSILKMILIRHLQNDVILALRPGSFRVLLSCAN